MVEKEISSLQNKKVKELFKLKEKSKERRKTGLLFVEGEREIALALSGSYEMESVYYNPGLFAVEKFIKLFGTKRKAPNLYSVSVEVYQKIAHRGTTEGIFAIFKAKDHSLSSLQFNTKNPLILVAEAPEKPGNIGALLRTADAANLDAVLIVNPKTDLYNPNIIRSSVGCIFTTQIATGGTSEIIEFLQKNNIAINCAALQASKTYHKIDFKRPSAIVVGTEATGLSEEWLNNSAQNILIPMSGKIDSMNVSVAAGILIFEAKRQRELGI